MELTVRLGVGRVVDWSFRCPWMPCCRSRDFRDINVSQLCLWKLTSDRQDSVVSCADKIFRIAVTMDLIWIPQISYQNNGVRMAITFTLVSRAERIKQKFLSVLCTTNSLDWLCRIFASIYSTGLTRDLRNQSKSSLSRRLQICGFVRNLAAH